MMMSYMLIAKRLARPPKHWSTTVTGDAERCTPKHVSISCMSAVAMASKLSKLVAISYAGANFSFFLLAS